MAAPTLSDRITDLYGSLDEFKAESLPTGEIVPIYNALVDAAKEELPDDPVVKSLTRARVVGRNSSMSAGTMRAALYQVLTAMGETGKVKL